MDQRSPGPDDRGALIDALVADQGQWLLARCAKAAVGRPGLEAGDVYQQTVERLLRASVAVDPGRHGLRTFLGRCVDWVAEDLAGQRARHGGADISVQEFVAVLEAPLTEGDDLADDQHGIDVEFLAEIGLNEHQIRAVLNECGEPGVSAKEFAHLVHRSHDAVRKDKERALIRLRRWLGLDQMETQVFIAVRCAGSARAAAERIGISEVLVRELLARAQFKIDRKFNGRRAEPDVS